MNWNEMVRVTNKPQEQEWSWPVLLSCY